MHPSHLAVLLAAAIGAAGCAATPTGLPGGRAATALGAKQANISPRPTLEQAYTAARDAARRFGAKAGLATAGGYGIGSDGRLLADDAAWSFTFRLPDRVLRSMPRFVDVTVDASGAVRAEVVSLPRALQTWSYEPRVPAAKAIALAVADGLSGDRFHLHLAPADGLFTGAKDTPYLAPPTFMVGTDARYTQHRLVSARSGRLHHEPGASELEGMQRVIAPVIRRWHATLTGGGERPVGRADLLRIGMPAEAIDGYIAQYDRDGDRAIALEEFLAVFMAPQWLRAWREVTIKAEFYRADADGDELLSADEAARVAFEVPAFKGEPERFPLPLSAAELARADANGDGKLDLNEFVPLGLDKTLKLLELEPRAAHSFFSVQTKPWSH